MSGFTVRPAVTGDGAFLVDMLADAASGPGARVTPRGEVLGNSGHARYVAGWRRATDEGVIALDDSGVEIGAAWYRLLPPDAPGYGWVATAVPELVIAVRPLWRAHGVGRVMLRELLVLARRNGFSRISLSVQHGNHASALYRSEGFSVFSETPDRATMVRTLS